MGVEKKPLSVAETFRREIAAAEGEGVAKENLTLHLTLRDHDAIRRDPKVALEEISFVNGLHFLGVKVIGGREVSRSVLERTE